MITKSRTVPIELLLLRSIRARQKVSEKIENQVHTLEKGFIGETWFDQRLESLSLDCLILNDLLLETNNTHYQIDSLLISRRKIHIFEVKNYEGDYVVNGDRWQSSSSGIEIKNPLLQLTRSESLFRQLLQQLRSDFTIESHLVFINPEFYLYQASPNLPIIFPSQLKRFICSLNAQPSRLVERHHTLAKNLLSQHIKKSPYSIVPAYNFDEFAKGILCSVCWSGFMVSGSQHKLTCRKCGNVEDIKTAILRSVKELKILFPDIRISTKTIFDWCNTVKDKRTIRKVLANNYNYVSLGKYSYYEFKE
ncbi:nuclease-related domain-containing protein [Bacillus sp. HNG]|uniref:nuclease-related domain-containing protein n=1 Tax=Bacillus sp. HNG TaxID=2293325 RepID=UPI00167AD89B|nr:nuclease-related domain-containing protein [Bacillus sp. HNG]